MADDAHSSDASCTYCGYGFCASCDFPPHGPATCQQVLRWNEREGYLEIGSEEDILARQCKLKTTKPCPKCGVRIEKNEGCPHMTCKFCRHQFCWDCGGEFHTTTACNRPKVSTDSNPIFEFEELNRECISHFSLRQQALKKMSDYIHDLERRSGNRDDSLILRLIIEGWRVVAESQSALAHACIVRYDIKTDKIKVMFHAHELLTQIIQRKIEKLTLLKSNYPENEIKSSIHHLRSRTREFVLAARVEMIQETSEEFDSTLNANRMSFRTQDSSLQRLRRSPSDEITATALNEWRSAAVFGVAFDLV